MRKGHFGLKALGLGLLASLAAMALVAASAQAAGPQYYVEGQLLQGVEEVESEGGPFELLTPNLGVEVWCEHELDEGTIFNDAGGPGLSEETIKFERNCKVLEAPVCGVEEPITVEAHNELVYHEGEVYTIFYPATLGGPEDTFVVLNFTGPECPLPAQVGVSGSIAGLASPGPAVNGELHFNDGINELICVELAKCGLFFGTEPASLDGLTDVWLSGPHFGDAWEVK